MSEIKHKKDYVSTAVFKASSDLLKIKTVKDKDLLNVLTNGLEDIENET